MPGNPGEAATTIVMFLWPSFGGALAFGGGTDSTAEERRQYEQDLARVRSVVEPLSAGKVVDLKTLLSRRMWRHRRKRSPRAWSQSDRTVSRHVVARP